MPCFSWSFAWNWTNLVKQLRLLIIQLMCGNKLGYIWLIRSDTTVQYSSPDLKFGSPTQKLRDVSSSPRLKPAPQQSPVLPQGSSPIVREQQCKSESSFSSVVSSNGISPSNNQNETISTIVSPAENHVLSRFPVTVPEQHTNQWTDAEWIAKHDNCSGAPKYEHSGVASAGWISVRSGRWK